MVRSVNLDGVDDGLDDDHFCFIKPSTKFFFLGVCEGDALLSGRDKLTSLN